MEMPYFFRNGARLLKLNGMSVDRWSHNALVDQFSAINVETIETVHIHFALRLAPDF